MLPSIIHSISIMDATPLFKLISSQNHEKSANGFPFALDHLIRLSILS